MIEYLGITEDKLKSFNAIHTAREISEQPDLWRKIADQILDQQHDIRSFIEKCLNDVDSVILTGAGTSSYIGLSLQGLFLRKFKKNTSVIPTTDIVTHPADYFPDEKPVLLISFARSGNSPESKAVVEMADKICCKCYHLIITCDEEGILAGHKTNNPKYLLVLPQESNDKGLAMTGSYSGMLLAGILITDIFNLDPIISQIDILSNYGDKVIKEYALPLKQISGQNFERAVFLGSGPFFGTAAESHLKLQELTDGKILCKQESFLGFRHGPKAIVHANTLLGYIFSNNSYVYQYEVDLVRSIAKEQNPMVQIGICENACANLQFDLMISFSDNKTHIDECFLTVCSILPGQILGFYKSLEQGLNPDSPSANNVISRVVKGVQIYDYVTN